MAFCASHTTAALILSLRLTLDEFGKNDSDSAQDLVG